MQGLQSMSVNAYYQIQGIQPTTPRQNDRQQVLDHVAQTLNISPKTLLQAIEQIEQQQSSQNSGQTSGASGMSFLDALAQKLGISVSSLRDAFQQALKSVHQGEHHHHGGHSAQSMTETLTLSFSVTLGSTSTTSNNSQSTTDGDGDGSSVNVSA